MRYEKREKLKVLALNTRNILLKIIDVSQGGTSSIAIDLKDILSEPIKIGAAKIILVHNHPAGSTIPSQPDIQLTQKLYNVAYQLGIEFIDHIIIAKDKYESIFRMAKIGE